MKHLISLSFKYIRRQKLRTTLTFLCVVLSVFIFSSFGAYASSIYKTLFNLDIRESGSWEADISYWMENSPDKNALDIVKNHSAVEKYNIMSSEYLISDFSRFFDNKVSYINFSDGKNEKRISSLRYSCMDGGIDLYPHMDAYVEPITNVEEGTFAVPSWLQEFGYNVGDTLTFTLNRVDAEFDEESGIIKDARQYIFEETGYYNFRDDPEIMDLPKEEKDNICHQLMAAVLNTKMDVSIDDFPLTNESSGEKFEYSIKIGSFFSTQAIGDNIFHIYKNGSCEPMFDKLAAAEFSDLDKNDEEYYKKSLSAYIRINEDVDYEDAMQLLYENLGFSGVYYAGQYLCNENSSLLALELRSAGMVMTMLPLIGLLLFVCLLMWFVARFVIDNAFEISAKERSSQYAALRIMGASKSQIAAVVFTEAIFYIITAVPIGTLLAYIFCSSNMSLMRSVGFQDFEFYYPPVIVIAVIALSVIAILISAFTSSMWASRKLSPAEALNFGKPKSRKKKTKHRKHSKLKLSSKKFMRRYTWKNIMRTKSRFVIASITMTLGVTLFLFSLMTGIAFAFEWKDLTNEIIVGDFVIDAYEISKEDVDKAFGNDTAFSMVETSAESAVVVDGKKTAQFAAAIKPLIPENYNIKYTYCEFVAVDKYAFEKDFAEPTGMTYEEFVRSDGALYATSIYGEPNYRKYENEGSERKPVKFYDEFYKPLPAAVTLDLNYDGSAPVKVIGGICCEKYTGVVVPVDSKYFSRYFDSMRINLVVNGMENYDAAQKSVDNFVRNYTLMSYENLYMISTGLNEFIKAIVRIALSFVLAVWLVGILSMVNSINTGVLNRSRELVMLRSVGMNRKQLRSTVMLESLLFSSVSSICGTILAVLAYLVILESVDSGIFPVLVMIFGIVLSILINVGIAILASIPGIRSLERVESLVKQY